MRFSLLKIFLYFRKWHFLTPSLKNSLGEQFRVFYHCFFRCCHFTTGFYYCFWVFLLLIAFVYFDNPKGFHHCFFRRFYFTSDFIIASRVFSFHQIFLPWLLFVSYFVFVVVLQVRELFLLSGIFYLTLLSDIWHNLLSSRLP